MTIISQQLQDLIGKEFDEKSEQNGVKPLGGGVCNKASCSCSGYYKGDEPGTCGCGHKAYDHI